MPVVPRYEPKTGLDQPKVSPTAIPDVSVTTEAPRAAFGGGPMVGAAYDAGVSLLSKSSHLVQEIHQDASRAAAIDAKAQLRTKTNDLFWNPEKGAMTRRGKNAIGMPDEFVSSFDEEAEKIAQNLSGLSRKLFDEDRVSQRQEFHARLLKHEFDETLQFDKESTASALKAANEDAVFNYQEPGKIESILKEKAEVIKAHAYRQGYDDKATKLMLLESSSDVHKGVIERMLVNGQDQMAEAYYTGIKKDMTRADSAKMQEAVQNASRLGQAQRNAQQITAKYSNMAAALKEIDQIKDPKVQELTKDQVKERFALLEAGKKQYKDTLYEAMAKQLETSKDLIALKRDPKWLNLDSSQRSALESRYEHLVKGIDKPNDDKAWLDFLDLSSAQLSSLSRSDFEAKYWAKLDKAHRTRAEGIWDAAKSTNERDPKITSALSFTNRVDNALRKSKLIAADKEKSKFTKSEATLFAEFEETAARDLENFEILELQGKRKATGEEQQKIIDKALIQFREVRIPGFFFSDKKRLSEVTDLKEAGQAYIPVDDIPQAEKNAIEKMFTARKIPMDRRKLERAYFAYLKKDKALLNLILSGK